MKYARTVGVLTTILVYLSNLFFSTIESTNLHGNIVRGGQSSRLLALGVNTTTPEALTLIATYESMSVYAPYSGDDNGNNQAQLYYRASGAAEWRAGMAMTVDRRTSVTSGSATYPNPYVRQWRASLIGLQSNQLYEVRVVFSDPDGLGAAAERTQSLRTLDESFPASGSSYYVATTGSDSNPGSQSQPFRTIQKGVNGLKAGDRLLIRGGVYHERVVLNQRVGSPSNWITIQAYPNETVTLDGQNSLAHNLYIGGGADPKTQFVRIQGLRLLNARTAIAINEHASDIAIDGNRLEGFVDSGIYIGLFSLPNIPTGHIIIQNNTIVRNKLPGASGGTNIGLYNNTGGNIIRNNVIEDITGNPNDISSPTHLDCIGGGSDFQMGTGLNRDTDVYNNTITDCSDDGIQADGIAMNVRIWGNTLRGVKTNWSGISLVPSIVGPVYIFRNLVIGQLINGLKQGQNSTGAQYIYQNTFYSTRSSADGFFQSDSGLKNVTALNNIIQGGRYAIEYPDSGSSSDNRFDYNNLYSTDPNRFVKLHQNYLSYGAFRDLGYETHGLNLNATNEFVDPKQGNYHLKAGSPLVDQGVVIPGFNDPHSRWPYRGAAPDLGAFELTARRSSHIAP